MYILLYSVLPGPSAMAVVFYVVLVDAQNVSIHEYTVVMTT